MLRLPGFSFDDLPPDAPEHEVAENHQSRLGKGLSAIMPGSEAAPAPRKAGGLASVIPLGPDTDDGPSSEAAAPARGATEGAQGAVGASTTLAGATGSQTKVAAPSATPSSAGSAAPSSTAPSGGEQPSPTVQVAPATPALAPTAARLVARLHGDLVTALLEGLAAETAADLVAYLHQPDRGAPRLHLGRPALADLTPAGCFDLCTAMDGLARSRPGVVVPLVAGGFDGVAIVVAGTGARGLWVAARTGRPLAPDEVDAAVDYARNTGAAATLLDLANSHAPPAMPHLDVRVAEGQVLAEVRLASGSASSGAPTGVEAAARATLEASGSAAEFLYAAAAREEQDAASIVLVRHDGRVGVGCAAGEGDAPSLTATATLRAAGSDLVPG